MSGVRILEESILAEDKTGGSTDKDLGAFPYISKEELVVQFNRLDCQVHQVG